MKIAMGVLAVGAIGLGVLQVPGVTYAVHKFLEPTFEDSRFYTQLEPSAGTEWLGLIVGTVLGLAGIALAYRLWVQDREAPARIRARLAGLHRLFVEQVVLRVKGVIVRTKKGALCDDGSYVKFDSNAMVLIDAEKNPRGTAHLRGRRPAVSPAGLRQDR